MSLTITEYRARLGFNQIEFGALFGLKSKGHVSEIENANRCAPEVALAIEAHSSGLVDAGAINPIIAAARQGIAA